MNEKSRLLNTLRGKPSDRPPFICPGGMMNMAVTELMDAAESCWPDAHSDPEKMARLTLAANRIGGIENTGVPFCMTVEAEAMGAQVYLGSRGNEPRVTEYAIDRFDEIDRLRPIDPGKGRVKVCVDAIRILKKEAPQTPVIANLTGPVSLASSLIDPLIFYKGLISDRQKAHKLMETVTENLIRFGDALVEAGADVICIADPSASGEILGKKVFAEFALPYINILVNYFREEHGIPSIVHICGDVRCLGMLLSEIAAESISVDAMVSINTLKELAPAKVSMGNVSTYLLEKGAPGDITKHGERCLKVGVDILAPACGISPKTSVANIKGLSRAALEARSTVAL
ncbi:MAG: methylcobamide--CoM methyltransferase [Betaproteobacteria bacterium]|nr:methylcobamide--CoM methyltransferase [Betaproteobacteria bacterium]